MDAYPRRFPISPSLPMTPRDTLLLAGLAAIWGVSFIFLRIAAPDFGALAVIGGN